MFKTVFSNVRWMFLSEIIRKVLTFLLTIAVVRTFAPIEYGELRFAFSFVVLFTIVTDFGLTTLIIRELSRNKDKVEKYIGNTFTLKIILNIVALLLIILITKLTISEPSQRLLLYLAGGNLFISSLSNSLLNTFIAFELMRFNAIGKVLKSIVLVGSGYLVIFSGLPIAWILGAHIGASLVLLVFAIFSTTLKLTRINFFAFDWEFSKRLLSEAWPFAITSAFLHLYYSFDIVMLGYLGYKEEVAWYGAAYTIIMLLVTFRRFFSSALYPTVSRNIFNAKEKTERVLNHFKKLFVFFALPIGVGITVLAPQIMVTLFGDDYINGALALQILVWGIVLSYLNLSQPTLLSASNRQKTTMMIMVFGGVLNVVLNLILIPQYKLVGAAIATDVANLSNLALASYFAGKIIRIRFWSFLPKPAVASLVMGMVIFYFIEYNLFLLIAVGFIIYVGLILILRFFTEEELDFARRYFEKTLKIRH